MNTNKSKITGGMLCQSKTGTRVPVCPKEKADAIVEALRYFKMLKYKVTYFVRKE